MENTKSVNVCDICSSIFTRRNNLLQHQRTVHATSKELTCHECNYKTSLKSNFKRHLNSKHPNSVKCLECTFTTSKKSHLLLHKRKEHPKNQKGEGKVLSIDSQPSSFSVPSSLPSININKSENEITNQDMELMKPSTDVASSENSLLPSLPHQPQDTSSPQQRQENEFNNFFNGDVNPWGEDEQLQKVYRQHFHLIKNQEILQRHIRTYIRYLDENNYTLIQAMENTINQIYRLQTHQFKINLSFSYILQHRETREYRFYFASNNNQLLNLPKLILNQEDVNKLIEHLSTRDLPSIVKQHRPNSKWMVERIVNLRLKLFLIY